MSDTDSTTLIAPGATRRNLIIGGAGVAAGITLPSAAALAAAPAGRKHHQTEQGRPDMGTFTTKDGTSVFPTHFIHGDDDQIVPIADSSMLAAKLVKNGTLKVYAGAPRGLATTHKEQLNADLLAFLKS